MVVDRIRQCMEWREGHWSRQGLVSNKWNKLCAHFFFVSVHSWVFSRKKQFWEIIKSPDCLHDNPNKSWKEDRRKSKCHLRFFSWHSEISPCCCYFHLRVVEQAYANNWLRACLHPTMAKSGSEIRPVQRLKCIKENHVYTHLYKSDERTVNNFCTFGTCVHTHLYSFSKI